MIIKRGFILYSAFCLLPSDSYLLINYPSKPRFVQKNLNRPVTPSEEGVKK
jgi:hypothetical protein